MWDMPAALAADDPITLKLNWKHGITFIGFYVAEAQGFYAEEGLSVTIEPQHDVAEFETTPQQVSAGKFDFALGGPNLVTAQGRGLPLIAIAGIFQFSPHVFFARSDSGIVTPADLAGRRVVVKSPAWRKTLELLLQHAGLTLADVIEVPGGHDISPFISGEVEVWSGYIYNEVPRARLRGVDVVLLPLYEYGIFRNAITIYMNRDAMSNDPDRAVRFVRASLRGWQWAIDHRAAAVDLMRHHYPALPEPRDFYLASLDASIPLMIPVGTRLGSLDCERWLTSVELAQHPTKERLCTTAILQVVWQKR